VMQPIHQGLGNEGLYNANAMRTVNICLDSGKLATDDCHHDARGINRVVSVLVYPEDAPTEKCDKHIAVHYCVDGGGIANEYCTMVGDANVQTMSLVKLTPAEVREIRDAKGSGLVDEYLDDGYVYYVDENGEPLNWTGFRGNLDCDGPCLYCQMHDDDFWGDFDDPFGEGWGDGYGGDYGDGYGDYFGDRYEDDDDGSSWG